MNTLMPVTRLLDAALNGGLDACRAEPAPGTPPAPTCSRATRSTGS